MSYESLVDKRILVTGSSSGIGLAIANLLAISGAKVGYHYNKNNSGELFNAEDNVRTACFKADLLVKEDRDRLVEEFIDTFGGIDILVNNAGAIIGTNSFEDMTDEEFDSTMDLNAKAAFCLSRDSFVWMVPNGGGKIINISSVAVKYGGSAQTMHYGMAKAAMEAMTIGMSRCGAPHKILVNAVRCGFINTNFHSKIGRSKADIEKRIQMIPLKRPGEPKEVAQMVAYLASKHGDYITGQVLTIAGGD